MGSDAAVDIDGMFQAAFALHQQGRRDQAEAGYLEVLSRQPAHPLALNYLAVIALQADRPRQALEWIDRAIRINPGNVLSYVNQGGAHSQLGDHEAAIASYDHAVAIDRDGELAAVAFYNRGTSLQQLGRPAEALASFDEVLDFESPYEANAHYGRGTALLELGEREAAADSFERAVAVDPALIAAHRAHAVLCHQLQRYEAALASHDRALVRAPDEADLHHDRGATLAALGRHAEAVESYDRAIALRPYDPKAFNHKGLALHHLNRLEDAIAAFGRALALAPADPDILNNLAVTQAADRNYRTAIAGFDAAIAAAPATAKFYNNRGLAEAALKDHEAAIASFDRALALDAGIVGLLGVRLAQRMQICDWHDLGAERERLAAAIDRGEPASQPFVNMTLFDSAALQRKSSEIWARTNFPPASSLPPLPRKPAGAKIRIGYFSADFHAHATMHLMAGVFERHDKAAFDVVAFSLGPDSRDEMRRRLEAACDRVVDVRRMTDLQVAAMARSLDIDIAVDLNGLTDHNRAGIFAERAAPIQVNFLGYPGTMGAPFMDYLIADPWLIPASARRHYAEQIVYMPHSYQVNDADRRIATTHYSRADLGLPPTGFVFCCFNTNFKILPETFDVWMRILARTPGSVLWLLADNAQATRNLRAEAVRRSVDPARLVFAERAPMPEHLARQRVADLVLDTLPCNAHTTASDALWAGVPLLTCSGEAFAGRVAGSLLHAVGLPELVAANAGEFEELAVRLANTPALLAELRQRLADRRRSAPLFDTALSTRHLESGYRTMVERYHAGLPAESFRIGVG